MPVCLFVVFAMLGDGATAAGGRQPDDAAWKESVLGLDEEFWYRGTEPADPQRATYARDAARADAQALVFRAEVVDFVLSGSRR